MYLNVRNFGFWCCKYLCSLVTSLICIHVVLSKPGYLKLDICMPVWVTGSKQCKVRNRNVPCIKWIVCFGNYWWLNEERGDCLKKQMLQKKWMEERGICWVSIERYLTVSALKGERENGRQRSGEEREEVYGVCTHLFAISPYLSFSISKPIYLPDSS